MKNTILSIITLCTITTVSCNPQKTTPDNPEKSEATDQRQKIEKIELTEQTRGTNKRVTFTPSSATITLNDNVTTSMLSGDDWINITKQANSLDLDKISTFAAPTTDRFSDKALSSTIIITSGGKTYQSSEFDAGVPPKELAALYQLLKTK